MIEDLNKLSKLTDSDNLEKPFPGAVKTSKKARLPGMGKHSGGSVGSNAHAKQRARSKQSAKARKKNRRKK